MKVSEVYPQTRLDQINTSGSASRLERTGTGAVGEDRAGSQGVGSQSDQVELSSTGRDVQLFLDAARQLPDVRTDKVQEIKNKYGSGNYSADPKQLAEKIVSKGDFIDFRG